MKYLLKLLLILPIMAFGQQTFLPQGHGTLPKDYTVNCIFPLNDNEVWALASNINGSSSIKLCKTLDGGQTWIASEIDTAIKGYADDIFVQANGIAYVNLEDLNLGNQWYKTLDGGSTWYKMDTNLGTFIHMYNLLEGSMISVQSGLSSNDSFHTHSTVRSAEPGGPPSGIGQSLLSGPNSRCVNDSGVFFIYPKGLVVRTQDKGKTWKGFDVGLYINKSTCGIAASGNSILAIQWPLTTVVKKGLSRSKDGGNTWSNISANIPAEIIRPSVIASVPNDNAHFLMTGYSEIYHSVDTGNNWNKITLPLDMQIRMSGVLMMSSSNTAWIGMTTNSDTQSIIYRGEMNFKPFNIEPRSSAVNKTIYPNPVKDILYLQADEQTEYSVFNAAGQLILKGNCLSKDFSIDVSNLKNGVYYVQCKTFGALHTEKFIHE